MLIFFIISFIWALEQLSDPLPSLSLALALSLSLSLSFSLSHSLSLFLYIYFDLINPNWEICFEKFGKRTKVPREKNSSIKSLKNIIFIEIKYRGMPRIFSSGVDSIFREGRIFLSGEEMRPKGAKSFCPP